MNNESLKKDEIICLGSLGLCLICIIISYVLLILEIALEKSNNYIKLSILGSVVFLNIGVIKAIKLKEDEQKI